MKDGSPKSPGQMRAQFCPIETTAGEEATLLLKLDHGDAALLEGPCPILSSPVPRPRAFLGHEPGSIEKSTEELHACSAS